VRAWLRQTAIVVGVGVVVCLATTIAVGFRTRVSAAGISLPVEAAGLIFPGALAVLLAVYSDPKTASSIIVSRSRSRWWSLTRRPIPPLDEKTAGTIGRQNDALYAGGIALLALGIAIAVLT
jgi:hypothetical protein